MSRLVTYDGSFNGFLAAIFDIYTHKLKHPIIQAETVAQEELFGEIQHILTDLTKSERVGKKLKQILGSADFNHFYRAFMSEQPQMENHLLEFCRVAFKTGASPLGDYGNQQILKISQASKMTGREKHRMEAFIRFHLIDDDIYFANCEPDCNVLPLIASHFKNRYADQKWVIYDLKRNFGIYYDLKKVEDVTIDFKDPKRSRGITNSAALKGSHPACQGTTGRFRESENNYRDLWNQYFKSTNIESRKNMKLHLQHVPKRYWKYLSEKVA